jgi:histidine ammonia-lyase
MLNRGVHPRVPSRGSVGASGDLAPLAHVALVLIGEGEVWDGSAISTAGDALRAAELTPVVLEPKEGLALINGTQVSTAVLGLALAGAERLARAADIAAALSIDGLQGSIRPFDARIHTARPFLGQSTVASNLSQLLTGSPINASHANCGRVQDAYSMRCVPQVHGAARDAMHWIRQTIEIEMNAATDNPMVFAETSEIISGGNFHGAPVALAADLLVLALAQLATISERRAERLVNPALSGLPAFLTRHGGLQSGLMLAQVTAAALTSEVKTLAHPASADTIPTSANKEDHVSMSMAASLKSERALQIVTRIVAIEILCACQAIDLLAPLTTTAALMQVVRTVRERVATLADDRPPSPDIEAIASLIRDGALEYASRVVVN